MSHTRPIAELHDAYVWDCDACGAEQFERAVVVSPESLDDETCELLTEAAGGEWHTGHFVTRPDAVTCRECGTTYDAEDADLGDDDDCLD